MAALGLWAATPGAPTLLLAAVGVVAAALWGSLRGRTVWALGIVVLLAGILAGFYADRQVRVLTTGWDEYWTAREAEVGQRLSAELQSRFDAGERAATTLSEMLMDTTVAVGGRQVAELRRSLGLAALAYYDNSGNLRVWDGVHRGKVPEEVQRGLRQWVYKDRPLFGYLYHTAVAAGGRGTVVVAFLLRTDLPEALGADADDFASTFRKEVGETVRVTRRAPDEAEGVWDLELPDQTLLSFVVQEPSQARRVDQVLERWQLAAGGLALLGWLLLALGAPPRLASGGAAAVTLVSLAATSPLERLGAVAPLFDLQLFALPGPLPMSLGRLAMVTLAAVTAVAVLPRPRIRLPGWTAGVLAGLLLPLLLAWLRAGVTPTGLAAGELPWIAYQASATILIVLAVGTLLVFSASVDARKRWGVAAAVLGASLGAAAAGMVWTTAMVPTWWAALWAAPVGMAAYSVDAWKGWTRPLAAWSLAVVLGATAVIPAAWADRVDARMARGTEHLERLRGPEDPELERTLFTFGMIADSVTLAVEELADSLDGEEEAELLYEAWRQSGLAALGRPAWITLWSSRGERAEELRVGVGPDRPPLVREVWEETREAVEPRMVRYDAAELRYVLATPVSRDRAVTVAVPPFSERLAGSPLQPLLGEGGEAGQENLSLIPLLPEDDPASGPVHWSRVVDGWQAEVALHYPGIVYHAHYDVELPGQLLAVARGTLLLVLDLGLIFAFWLMGRGLLREVIPYEMRLSGLVISFRARVTLALFAFFLLANAIFGTLAYESLDNASRRAAQVLAERVVDDAASWYVEVQGEMAALARRVGAELLEYRGGELREGSVQELVELGLYEGWMPMDAQRVLGGGAGVREFTETSLGDWQYVTAYRRLPDGDVLAAQIPLRAGATAIRTSDLLELLGFAVVLGAALSLALAFLVGRALTRPIHALQVASERVGGGNLKLRLPADRADEFGSVFSAFNRMVSRLRRARRQLVRTTRRTKAIMEEAAVGMVALDPGGRVTLVNPRAEALLERPVEVGKALPDRGPLGEELATWLEDFLEGDDEERDLELTPEDRRVRVRARRLGTFGTRGGAVVAIEDVTDELRTERVLAWGEMARQVAHEVKNPLTPMKLSIQHIRRAWEDRRGDFDDILVKNADAMLKEIDRLATIAQSFSRFGAPSGRRDVPLAPVDLPGVVDEVLALYGGSEGSVAFRGDLDEELPPVMARTPETKEVLVNLLENARDAVRDGGSVVIEAHHRPAGGVELSVSDDGSGIDADLMHRIFEPHFSTRSTGTGLGLAIVERLVESWGGTVRVESAPDVGTRVTMHLREWPASEEPGGGDAPPEPAF